MRVLVIAPHPDDEAIGVGGQIALHAEAGDEVEVLYLTQGELGCPGEDLEETATKRVHEGFEAGKVLGSTVIGFWKEPDGSLAVNSQNIGAMAVTLTARRPTVVYVTHELDGHADHRAAAEILRQACEKSLWTPQEIWMYEVWSPMAEYNKAVDITDVIGIKLRAIRRHESQVNRIRFDEAALALARFRGELHNRPHGMYAEVFRGMTV